MQLFAHAVNNVKDLNKPLYDGLEIDFQLCDNNLINTHHFYFGSPFKKTNWFSYKNYVSLKPYQSQGLCYDLKTIVKLVKKDKLLIIDLKNWVLKLPGIIFGNGSAYLHNQKEFAHVFWDIMTEFKKQENIFIQSYDHDLIVEIIETAKARKIINNFSYGLIIRTNFQVESAIKCCQKYNIAFLAIRYKQLKKLGGKEKLLQKIKKPIKIYGWFDIDDFYIKDFKREKLINKANYDGYIK